MTRLEKRWIQTKRGYRQRFKVRVGRMERTHRWNKHSRSWVPNKVATPRPPPKGEDVVVEVVYEAKRGRPILLQVRLKASTVAGLNDQEVIAKAKENARMWLPGGKGKGLAALKMEIRYDEVVKEELIIKRKGTKKWNAYEL